MQESTIVKISECDNCIFNLQDHEFIPTRMKTIQASRPVANPQQYTRVPSNPLLVSAQRQMELAEEVKRQKEMARRNSEREDVDAANHFNGIKVVDMFWDRQFT